MIINVKSILDNAAKLILTFIPGFLFVELILQKGLFSGNINTGVQLTLLLIWSFIISIPYYWAGHISIGSMISKKYKLLSMSISQQFAALFALTTFITNYALFLMYKTWLSLNLYGWPDWGMMFLLFIPAALISIIIGDLLGPHATMKNLFGEKLAKEIERTLKRDLISKKS